MKRIKSFLLLIVTLISLSFLSENYLYAGEPTETVKKILNKVMEIQTDPKLRKLRNKRRLAIKKVIQKNFDSTLMAKNALGSYWDKLSKKEKEEFAKLFEDLFQESYTKMVLDFLKKETIKYEKEEKRGDEVIVKTKILKMEDEIPVYYHLRKVGKRWLIFDVDIDEVSIVGNYRRAFSRVIRMASFKALMKKMRLQQEAIKKAYAEESAG